MEQTINIRDAYPFILAHYAVFLWAALFLAGRLQQPKLRAWLVTTFWQLFFFPFVWVYVARKAITYFCPASELKAQLHN
ncbi:hypothetical protein [Alteromonas sp. H39]|uniref:hypothetical protein n=1 Tax=Alteromonas sp. H39 TaxID=3389876 RepID=UPI0039E104B6